MNDLKEVRYDKYCSTCKYRDLDESQDPCDDCLASPMNINSHKPICYEEEK